MSNHTGRDTTSGASIAAPKTAAHAVLIDHAGMVLLVQPSYKTHWHLPGGYVHEGEPPSAGVAREVCEEVGISPALPPSPAVIAWAPSNGDRFLFYYVAHVTAQQAQAVTVDREEIVDARWRHPGDLHRWLHAALAERVHIALTSPRRDCTTFLETPGHRPSPPLTGRSGLRR